MYCVKNNVEFKISEYLNPDFIYLPILDEYNIYIKTKEIKKGSKIFTNGKKVIYSPISGNVIGSKMMNINDKNVKTLVVENDYKEEKKSNKGAKKNIDKYSKEEIKEIIDEYLLKDYSFENKTLIINGLEIDPYEGNNIPLINNNFIELLDSIDILIDTYNIKETILISSNLDENIVTKIVNNLGSYPRIKLKLIPNIYPINDDIISKYLKISNIEVITYNELINFYHAMRWKIGIIEKYVTFGGNAIKEEKIIKVKIGTPIKDIIDNELEIKNKKYHIIYNGLISGKRITAENNIIDYDTRSVFLSIPDKSAETKCINCGLCSEYCPVKLNPKSFIKGKCSDKCLNCGLCTYICPSKINFKKYIKGDFNE